MQFVEEAVVDAVVHVALQVQLSAEHATPDEIIAALARDDTDLRRAVQAELESSEKRTRLAGVLPGDRTFQLDSPILAASVGVIEAVKPR
jgi:hypothetical protein